MDKKTSFVLYPADFLAAVHNFKKSQIADLIIALCEINFYGEVSFKLSEPVKKRILHEYIQKGVRAVYYIVSTRTITGKEAKQDEVIDANVTDLRLAFELEFSHKIFNDIKPIDTSKFISYTFIDTTFDKMNEWLCE